jgi:dipeptidase
VTLRNLSTILKNHFEKTEFDLGEKNPHKNKIRTLCADHTQYSFIAQLRNWLPGDIGNVLWFAPRRSCVQPFIPIYFGINTIPEKFEKEGVVKSQAYHFDEKRELKKLFPDHASWIFSEYAKRIDRGFRKKIEKISNEKDMIESELYNYQPDYEKKVVEVYGKDILKAKNMLAKYTEEHMMLILNNTMNKIE